MSRRVAVVDANVLYSIELTDLLATLAVARLVRLHWSPTILDETRRNLAERHDLRIEAIDRRIEQMNRALPAALDEPDAKLIDSMPIAEHDRHVLALAVHVEADSIVTFNLRDFPVERCEPLGVVALDPDALVSEIASGDVGAVRTAVTAMARRRARPPVTFDQLVDRFEPTLPTFVEIVRGSAG